MGGMLDRYEKEMGLLLHWMGTSPHLGICQKTINVCAGNGQKLLPTPPHTLSISYFLGTYIKSLIFVISQQKNNVLKMLSPQSIISKTIIKSQVIYIKNRIESTCRFMIFIICIYTYKTIDHLL